MTIRQGSGLKKAIKTLKESLCINVIVDTREKTPWDFSGSLPKKLLVKEVKVMGLKFGDYSIEGYEQPEFKNSVIIERKASVIEFLANIGKNWERFQNELDGLSKYSKPLILIEDDLRDSYAKYKMRKPKKGCYFTLPPDFVISRGCEIDYKWGVKTLFLSNKYFAKRYACNIFRSIVSDTTIDGRNKNPGPPQ